MNAFEGCTGLKDVRLGKNVRTIGKEAFLGCKNIEFVELNDEIEKIEQRAFSGCERLGKISVFPKSLTVVED